MKKGLLALGVLALALVMAIPAEAHARQAEVTFARIGRSFAPPPLGRKDGWLTITNYDWKDYSIAVSRKGTLYISPATGGGTLLRSGTQITLALEKDTWDVYGASGEKLKVKVREGRTSTLDLQPFGYVGNTGLRGISNDGEKVRSEVLFDVYSAPPVVVQRPPVVVQQPPVIVQTPPPPPVIVQRPPVVIAPPVHRPPPRPSHRPGYRPGHGKRDGWGFTFGFNSK